MTKSWVDSILISKVQKKNKLKPGTSKSTRTVRNTRSKRFDKIKGESSAKRAIQIALFTGLNLGICGGTGTGKTFIIQSIRGAFPVIPINQGTRLDIDPQKPGFILVDDYPLLNKPSRELVLSLLAVDRPINTRVFATFRTCRCGYSAHPTQNRLCSCDPNVSKEYQFLLEEFLSRTDMLVYLNGQGSERFEKGRWLIAKDMDLAVPFHRLNLEAKDRLDMWVETGPLRNRKLISSCVKVAWSIAQLRGSREINLEDLEEALGFLPISSDWLIGR